MEVIEMETHKSKTKQGGEIIIHTDCTLKEMLEESGFLAALTKKQRKGGEK